MQSLPQQKPWCSRLPLFRGCSLKSNDVWEVTCWWSYHIKFLRVSYLRPFFHAKMFWAVKLVNYYARTSTASLSWLCHQTYYTDTFSHWHGAYYNNISSWYFHSRNKHTGGSTWWYKQKYTTSEWGCLTGQQFHHYWKTGVHFSCGYFWWQIRTRTQSSQYYLRSCCTYGMLQKRNCKASNGKATMGTILCHEEFTVLSWSVGAGSLLWLRSSCWDAGAEGTQG